MPLPSTDVITYPLPNPLFGYFSACGMVSESIFLKSAKADGVPEVAIAPEYVCYNNYNNIAVSLNIAIHR